MFAGKKSWPVTVLQENRPELVDTSVETSQSTPPELLLRAARLGKNGGYLYFGKEICS